MRIYKVQSNKKIHTPHGDRFIVVGVSMFDYLFVSFETRADYRYRETPGITMPTGVSDPTLYAREVYIDEANVDRQILQAKLEGVNLIRVGVEPAMEYTTSYVDPVNGKTYPSDMAILDTIIKIASHYGVVIQLQFGRDEVPDTHINHFLQTLTTLYKNNPFVWINPANEVNCANSNPGGSGCNVSSSWSARVGGFINTLRTAGWINPIVINPMDYGHDLAGVVTALGSSPFSTDPNLIIGVHTYKLLSDTSFNNRKSLEQTSWANYLNQFCVIVDETGYDNFTGRYDGELDPGVASVNTTEEAVMDVYWRDSLIWFADLCLNGNLNGVTVVHWMAYIPGLGVHDDNSLRRKDGSWTDAGNTWLKKYVQTIKSGSTPSTTVWATAFIAAVTGEGGLDLNGHNVRVVLPANSLSQSGSKFRITLKSPPTKSPSISDVFFGERATNADFTTTPTRIKFNGNNGVVMTAGGNTYLSDTVNLALDKTKTYMFSFAFDASNSMSAYNGLTGADLYYKAGAASSVGNTSLTGYTSGSNLWLFISKIEVE